MKPVSEEQMLISVYFCVSVLMVNTYSLTPSIWNETFE